MLALDRLVKILVDLDHSAAGRTCAVARCLHEIYSNRHGDELGQLCHEICAALKYADQMHLMPCMLCAYLCCHRLDSRLELLLGYQYLNLRIQIWFHVCLLLELYCRFPYAKPSLLICIFRINLPRQIHVIALVFEQCLVNIRKMLFAPILERHVKTPK